MVVAVPFIILLISWFIFRQKKIIKYPILIIVVTLEIFFSVNTLFVYHPIGKENITYSYLWVENYNWGYNQLDDYLNQLLKNKKPAVTFESRYGFLEKIKVKALVQAEKKGKEDWPVLLVYDSNMYDLATFWLFHRRLVYDGWPIITADNYLEEGKDFWTNQGIKDFYFFSILDHTILSQSLAVKTDGSQKLINELGKIKPEIIKRPDGREVFAVYYWQ